VLPREGFVHGTLRGPLALVAACITIGAAGLAGCVGWGACTYDGTFLLHPDHGRIEPLFNVTLGAGDPEPSAFANASYALVVSAEGLMAPWRFAFLFNETPEGGTMISWDYLYRREARTVAAGTVGALYTLEFRFEATSSDPGVREHVFFGDDNAVNTTIVRPSDNQVRVTSPDFHVAPHGGHIAIVEKLGFGLSAKGACP
jgi:hypothetical protein